MSPACCCLQKPSLNRIELGEYPSLNLGITAPEASGQLGSHQHHSPAGWQLASLSFPGCCSGLEGLWCWTVSHREKEGEGTAQPQNTHCSRERTAAPASWSPGTHQGTLQRAAGQLEGHRDVPSLLSSPSQSHQLSPSVLASDSLCTISC